MMSNNFKKSTIDYIIKNFGGSEADFIIDTVIEIGNKIFIFFLPSDTELMNSIGLEYSNLPGPVLYDIMGGKFSKLDPFTFAVEYGETEEFKGIQRRIKTQYDFDKIVSYLQKRGFLIFEDFERLFNSMDIHFDNIIFSYEDRTMEKIVLEHLTNVQIEILGRFLNKIKAFYSIDKKVMIIESELINSYSYYDRILKKVFIRI